MFCTRFTTCLTTQKRRKERGGQRDREGAQLSDGETTTVTEATRCRHVGFYITHATKPRLAFAGGQHGTRRYLQHAKRERERERISHNTRNDLFPLSKKHVSPPPLLNNTESRFLLVVFAHPVQLMMMGLCILAAASFFFSSSASCCGSRAQRGEEGQPPNLVPKERARCWPCCVFLSVGARRARLTHTGTKKNSASFFCCCPKRMPCWMAGKNGILALVILRWQSRLACLLRHKKSVLLHAKGPLPFSRARAHTYLLF